MKKLLTILLLLFTINCFGQDLKLKVPSIEVWRPVENQYRIDHTYFKYYDLTINNRQITISDMKGDIFFRMDIIGITEDVDFKKVYVCSEGNVFFITNDNQYLMVDHKLFVYKFNIKK